MNLKKYLGLDKPKKEKIATFQEMPAPIQGRIIKIALLATLLLIASIVLGAQTGAGTNLLEGVSFALIGVIFSIVLGYLCWATYMVGATGDYEVITGTCVLNAIETGTAQKVFYSIKRTRNIEIETADGKLYIVYYKEQKKIAKEGYPVTVYISKKTKPILKDGAYNIYEYLAIEASAEKGTPK